MRTRVRCVCVYIIKVVHRAVQLLNKKRRFLSWETLFALYKVYFLKTNKYSCAKSKKLCFMLFVFQKPVALQLCCSLMIISFVLKPANSKRRIVSKLNGKFIQCYISS